MFKFKNLLNKIYYKLKNIIHSIFTPIIQYLEQKVFDLYRLFFKVRVFDCFIFNNELDLLRLRLDYLKNTVDFFVIVEGKLTFTNKHKK